MRNLKTSKMRQPRLLAWTAGAALLVGCGSSTGAGGTDTTKSDGTGTVTLPEAKETKPVDTIAIANELVALWSNDAAGSAKFAADSNAIDQASGGCGEEPQPITPGDPGSGTDGSGGDGADDGCGGFDPEAAAKDVQEWFGDELFNVKFVNETLSTDKLVVLCAKAENFCSTDVDELGNETIDAKCAEGLAKVPVCLAISWHGDKKLSGMVFVGGDMAIQPATFQLTPELFNVQVDLAEIGKAAKAISNASGEELPEEFPTTLSGKVGAALVRGSDKVLTGTVSIHEKVHASAFTKGDKRHYDVQLAVAKDALKLVLGKQERAILGALKLGAIDVAMATDLVFGGGDGCGGAGEPIPGPGDPGPGDPGSKEPLPNDDGCGEPKPAYTGTLLAHVAGLSFDGSLSVAVDGSSDSIDLKGIGLGASTSTLQFDDGSKVQPLGSIDLNADAGRTFDFAAKFDGKTATFSAVPKLLLTVAHSLAPLAAQVKDIPAFLHAGTTSIGFTADGKPTFEMGGFDDAPATATPGGDPGKGGDPGTGTDPGTGSTPDDGGGDDFPHMKVLIGTLTLKATGLTTVPAEVLVTVKAGMCLDRKPEDASKVPGGDPGGGDGGGDGGGEAHLFDQLIEAVCK